MEAQKPTKEMIEAAVAAYWGTELGFGLRKTVTAAMERALIAALSVAPPASIDALGGRDAKK